MNHLDDLRYGLRLLRRHPSFSALALLTLSLGIGANTAVFSLIRSVLLKPLPYPDPSHLVWIGGSEARFNTEDAGVSIPDLLDLRLQSRTLSLIAAHSFFLEKYVLTGLGEAEQIDGVHVTANFFDVFGIGPVQGRTFREGEDKRGGPRVAVISHSLWMRDYAGDPKAIGRNIVLNSVTHEVVGVMPPGFQYPPRAEVWLPIGMGSTLTTLRDGRIFLAVGRTSKGAGVDAVSNELTGLAQRLEQTHLRTNTGYRFDTKSLADRLTGSVQQTLYLLAAVTGLLLLIASANIANLLLARGTTRRREFAIRQALGASRRSILGQLLAESMILALLGGIAGSVLAWWAVGALRAAAPAALPRVAELAVDPWALGFAVLVSIATALLFGLAPALQAVRGEQQEALKDGGTRGGGEAAGTARLRNLLVMGEVALAIVLLAGAGLLLESLRNLLAVDPGFRTAGVITTEISLPMQRFRTLDATATFVDEYLNRIRPLPGVAAAGSAFGLPIGGLYTSVEFKISNDPPPAVLPVAGFTSVTPGYFEAMSIPLKKGRLFDERDGKESARKIIIGEPLARQYFAGREAVGQSLEIIIAPGMSFAGEVVGVVGGVRHENLAQDPRVELYVPLKQFPYPVVNIVVRVNAASETVAAAMKRILKEQAPDLPPNPIRTMEEIVLESAAEERSRGFLTALFAIAALLLASFGIYGVMSYTVGRRTQEIGIRLAIGATPLDVLWLIFIQSGKLVLCGMALGLALALALGRLLNSLLYNVSAFDFRVLAGVSAVLMMAALLATIIPAWRAARIQPVLALRQD